MSNHVAMSGHPAICKDATIPILRTGTKGNGTWRQCLTVEQTCGTMPTSDERNGMAAAVLPQPGTEYGPCASCGHIDCEFTRKTATSVCVICTLEIGYEARYYNDSEYGIVHALCLEDRLGV